MRICKPVRWLPGIVLCMAWTCTASGCRDNGEALLVQLDAARGAGGNNGDAGGTSSAGQAGSTTGGKNGALLDSGVVDGAHEFTSLSSIEAWPDGLPAGYADDICKLQTAKYKLNACALIVACDGTTKIIVCERVAQSETAHCTCTLNDSSGRTPTSSEIPDVLDLPRMRLGASATTRAPITLALRRAPSAERPSPPPK